MESQLHLRGRRQYAVMKWLVCVLLVVEALLVWWALTQAMVSNLSVVLLVGNSVLLIWSASRLRRKPSCCR